ncbi:MAG: hypothetical protein F6K23_01515 [Okeania sp. SIO2C9]|uniref:hypothetical protein n=1 Tax=Okeania sp. SIO2C9 TaxID=2607791 RepID=UPI0013BEDACE|nr:hypothetical protein [Okeania sp. SIO2C9]NEQ71871.1 hypothetical protein [Okeania sp. SIO2C9]
MVEVNINPWGNGEIDEDRPIDTSDPTYVIVHGFTETGGNPGNIFRKRPTRWMSEMADNIRNLERDDANILLVDWQDARTLNYPAAAGRVDDVGVEVADYLLEEGVNPATTTLIGFSLGAHVVGEAGERLRESSGKVDLLIGLDPARSMFEEGAPLFDNKFTDPNDRLDANDADRVVALHTSRGIGYNGELADLDLYINWDDRLQPGSSGPIGNHRYAHDLYIDLLDGATFLQSNDTTLPNNIFSLDTIMNRDTIMNHEITNIDGSGLEIDT